MGDQGQAGWHRGHRVAIGWTLCLRGSLARPPAASFGRYGVEHREEERHIPEGVHDKEEKKSGGEDRHVVQAELSERGVTDAEW